MSYCTQSDLLNQTPEQELIELSEDTGSGGVDAAKVSAAIADADAEIDSYCAKGYTVPLSPVPALVRKLSVDIALYNLYSRRAVIPDKISERYKAAVRTLENIAKGVVTLGVVPAPAENPGQAASISTVDRVFSRETMEDF